MSYMDFYVKTKNSFLQYNKNKRLPKIEPVLLGWWALRHIDHSEWERQLIF